MYSFTEYLPCRRVFWSHFIIKTYRVLPSLKESRPAFCSDYFFRAFLLRALLRWLKDCASTMAGRGGEGSQGARGPGGLRDESSVDALQLNAVKIRVHWSFCPEPVNKSLNRQRSPLLKALFRIYKICMHVCVCKCGCICMHGWMYIDRAYQYFV